MYRLDVTFRVAAFATTKKGGSFVWMSNRMSYLRRSSSQGLPDCHQYGFLPLKMHKAVVRCCPSTTQLVGLFESVAPFVSAPALLSQMSSVPTG